MTARMSYLKLRDAATLIRRSERTVKRWIGRGLPTIMVDGTRYVEKNAFVEWAARHGRRRGRRHADEV